MGKKDTSKPRSVAVAIPVTFNNHPADAPGSSSAGPPAEINPELFESLQFLLISSRRHAGKYVFPKGGIEEGETASQAAIRETYEEAGLTAKAVLPLCDHSFISPRCHDGSNVPRASYQVFLILVDEMLPSWPEDNQRSRMWTSRSEAQQQTAWREEIAACFHLIPSNQELWSKLNSPPPR